MKNPKKYYTEWQYRIATAGAGWPLIAMPEFAPALAKVEAAVLETPDTPARAIVLSACLSVRLETVIEFETSQYKGPYEAPYPYAPTLLAIDRCLAHLDVHWRALGYEGQGPLYQSDRYAHYLSYCLFNPTAVCVPVTEELSLRDLNCIRAWPIVVLGASVCPIFGDRYINSPYDFWIHDAAHGRRNINLSDGLDCDVLQRDLDDFLARADAHPEFGACYNMLLFELLHDDAIPPVRSMLLERIREANGSEIPYEYLSHPNVPDYTQRLTERRNIQSGARTLGDTTGDIVKLHIFKYRSLSFAASVRFKIMHGFFDQVHSPREDIWPVRFRNLPSIEKICVRFLVDVLGLSEQEAETYRPNIHESLFNTKGLVEAFTTPVTVGADYNTDA